MFIITGDEKAASGQQDKVFMMDLSRIVRLVSTTDEVKDIL
ncbi:hypothetical protein PF005_g10174 [Phytophthora fragariae]|uniref:Uncharacterized protein n=2 Tax=Phytophthora TaxID=4783 RepID=A0A6A3EZ15_9STRA|nr:hypothetical protein PF003_g16858 [Phytophthora fragariae]KAE9035253.1 hypothetical protein PR002_g7678 [Phytophthora rubi]KAE8938649.1 hypothetical protein PF009_g11469 [Phytophthora fragariae]KAE9012549.1 hypothetical protein PF011_g8869 [Phytophthora fragariae]KAE9040082.1 hypothetical protein PR001_g7237 [Phytophthora rubi]